MKAKKIVKNRKNLFPINEKKEKEERNRKRKRKEKNS